MPLLKKISEIQDSLTDWRQHLHAYPELGFEEKSTSDFIAARLSEMGIPFERGLAKTGIVARIEGRLGHRTIGFRADMDALPISEKTELPYASTRPGVMHACGHDGHIAMLLGAARILSENANFSGAIVLIFQPAEETGGGARVMIEEGLFDRFPVDEIYGLHNWPGLPQQQFAVHTGPVMAAADSFDIELRGVGCHAGMPNQGRDPIVAGAQIIANLQLAISRRTAPTENAALSITQFHAGDTYNAIPGVARMAGTMRSVSEVKRRELREDLQRITMKIAEAQEIQADITLHPGYPVTCNSKREAVFAAQAAESISSAPVLCDLPASMGCEDFSYMLQKIPGCYSWLGSGPSERGQSLHSPHFDFNDALLPVGVHYWVTLASQRLSGVNA